MSKSRRAHPEVLGEAPKADHEPPRIAGRSLPVAPASRSRRPQSGKRIRLCPSCNAVALPIARFCPHCGASLRVKFATAMRPLDQTATTVERRPLTAVFCDLVGSSELATRMDPEDYAGVLRQIHLRVRETMEQYGGFLLVRWGREHLSSSDFHGRTSMILSTRYAPAWQPSMP